MLISLKQVEIEVEPEEVLFQALREGDLSINDAVSICEEEAGAQEVLESVDDEDIQRYCEEHGIELEQNFKTIVKSLKSLTQEERASLLWFIIGINNNEIKKVVEVELILPRLNELIKVKRSNENS